MTKEADAAERFEPIHESHAIEQIVIVLQFSKPIGDDSLAALTKEMNGKFGGENGELPGGGDIQSFSVAFGQPTPYGISPPSKVVGRTFMRTRPDGTLETELRIEQIGVTFRTSNYTRWDNVWAKAKTYFGMAIPSYIADGCQPAAVVLSFSDKFYWTGDAANCRANLLLRPQSMYVCPHIYGTPDLWHNHSGSFLTVDKFTKRLLNLNADCLDQVHLGETRRMIAIATIVTDAFNQPNYDPLTIGAAESVEFIATRIVDLHSFSKDVFAKVISDEMCKRIALKD